MNAPVRCGCGHHKAAHWHYGQMKGCGHHRGMLDRCRCIGYQPISRPIEDALTELLDAVAECERDWVLMDRIDFALGVSPRRR